MQYCPLSFCLDSYSNCKIDCVYCFLRRLNKIWDKELRPMDLENFERTLTNGLRNSNPKSPIAQALKQKKTIKFGNKSEPFQPAESVFRVSKQALEILAEMEWSVVIETKCSELMMEYLGILKRNKNLFVLINISPGFMSDWEVFEGRLTTSPEKRIQHLSLLIKEGINVGVTGEPFIPGYHTVKQFERTLRIIKSNGVKSYNIYNLHLNEFVIKRFWEKGLDFEKIWIYNSDLYWKPLLREMIEIAKKYDMILGCPDFINSGSYMESSNTCCGINVNNPCSFNLITWKKWIKEGLNHISDKHKINNLKENILKSTWDGVGNFELGKRLMFENNKDLFSINDIKWD